MPLFLPKEIGGWGRFPTQNCPLARPEKLGALAKTALSEEAPSVIARGLGRAYGDAALSENGVLLTERLNYFLDFDAQTGVLHAQCGVSFAQILETFVPLGWFLPVAPGTKFITLGGAIACDVHGKNHHIEGTISGFLEEFELLTASGEVLNCSRQQNPEIFWATLGGMGLTGVVQTAKIRLKPIETAYIVATTKRTQNLAQTLDELEKDGATPYTVAWIDGLSSGENLGRSVLLRGKHATKNDIKTHEFSAHPLDYHTAKKAGVPRDLPDFVLSPATVKLFNAYYYASHSDETRVLSFEPFFWPLDAIGNWNRIYGTRGFVQYQCVLPRAAACEGLTQILETIATSGRAAFLGVLKRHGAQNEAPLSFALDGFSLALDLPTTPDIREFCLALDEITLRFGGRIYLAKDATSTPQNVRKMFLRLEEFLQIKREIDPQNRFQSSLSRRLELF